MLEKVDLTKKMDKKEYKERMPELEAKLGAFRESAERKTRYLRVIWGGRQRASDWETDTGSGSQRIPGVCGKEGDRGRADASLYVAVLDKASGEGPDCHIRHQLVPEVMADRFEKKTPESEVPAAFESIRAFEKQLTDDGIVIIKLFLLIDKKEQKKRFRKLMGISGQ